MVAPDTKMLLALMLAFQHLEEAISPAEKSAFKAAAQQLYLDSEEWEFIQQDLLEAIAANPELDRLYRAAKTQLDAIDGAIPPDFIPTQAELEQVLPATGKVVKRPWEPSPQSERESPDEIFNMAINVLSTPDPADTAKNLSRLEKLWQFLNQGII